MRFTGLRVWGAMALGVFASAVSAMGQIGNVTGNTGPSVALSLGMDIPRFNVSTMKVERGDWVFKPVYEIVDCEVRVVGLFASAKPGTTTGLNFSSVYYQRPVLDVFGEWRACVWLNATASQSVEAVKSMYGISSFQDRYWEIEGLPAAGAGEEKLYKNGFAVDDPMGELVNSFDRSSRNETVELFEELGYTVADVPIEKEGEAYTRWWLTMTARMYDRTIGRKLSSTDLDAEYRSAQEYATLCFLSGHWAGGAVAGGVLTAQPTKTIERAQPSGLGSSTLEKGIAPVPTGSAPIDPLQGPR